MIRTRLVLNFPGFEPTGPEHQLGRIERTAEKTGQLWNFAFQLGEVHHKPGANHAEAVAQAKGADWSTTTRIVQFSWNDIIDSYEKVAFPRGLFLNFPKYMAFFADGTANRYWRASTRYWAFTFWPILQISISAIGALFLSYFAVSLTGLDGIIAILAVILLAAALTLLFCKWPGERSYMLLAINDWGFARDMVLRSNPVIEARYVEFAQTLAREIQNSDHDEIVISGHSFGSLWAVAALALALEDHPQLLKDRNVAFLALGSSLLKIALAGNATFMRNWTKKVWAQPTLFWHEIQTKDDIIAFYKSDPREELSVRNTVATMAIDRVNYKRSMDRKRYNRTRLSFFRMHRQYILDQDKRVGFDYLVRLFGPVSSAELARDPESIAAIDPQAALV